MTTPKLNAPATSPASNSSAWVEGKTHRGTDGETTARRRVIGGRAELEIKDGNGWLRCMGDGYFTPNDEVSHRDPKPGSVPDVTD